MYTRCLGSSNSFGMAGAGGVGAGAWALPCRGDRVSVPREDTAPWPTVATPGPGFSVPQSRRLKMAKRAKC